MQTNEKKISQHAPPRRIGRMVETIVGCKWSLTVMDLVNTSIHRPGAMERAVEGLTAKVLNDCLRLLVSFGVLEKASFAEIPPRVEYHFTTFGHKFRDAFHFLDDLEHELTKIELKEEDSACKDGAG